MSNIQPNPYNNAQGLQGNISLDRQQLNHNTFPASQLPPGLAGLKSDANSNSPHSNSPNSLGQHVDNLKQSARSSPVYSNPGLNPPVMSNTTTIFGNQSPLPPALNNMQNVGAPNNSGSILNSNASLPYPTNNSGQKRLINDNAPPLVPSSQFNQSLLNGPTVYNQRPPVPSNNAQIAPLLGGPTLPASLPYSNPASTNPQYVMPPSVISRPQTNTPISVGSQMKNNTLPNFAQNMAYNIPPRSSPLLNGPPTNLSPVPGLRPGFNGPNPHLIEPPQLSTMARPPNMLNSSMNSVESQQMGQTVGPLSNSPYTNIQKPPIPGLPVSNQTLSQNGPSVPSQPIYPNASVSSGFKGPFPLPSQPMTAQNIPLGQDMGPQSNQNRNIYPTNATQPSSFTRQAMNTTGPPMSYPNAHANLPGPPQIQSCNMPGQTAMRPGPPSNFTGNQSNVLGQPQLPIGVQGHGIPNNIQGPLSMPGPPSGPPLGNLQNRYPQMPPSNFVNQQPMPQGIRPNSQQINHQGLNQQMGQLSVTKQGFDQLWGHQMVDLLQTRHILPEYAVETPEIKLTHQFADSNNCSPEIFRCTVNRIPETNSLLQKSRLPLGILIHPFKDLNHLPVIQCATIVRCRACRTYINPFVYFVDSKRWKCNLCFRVNDLPEEFQYDPVSKSYGDPSRRPEIKSATIEFIAPGEYMLRPPQPAVYLFLMDVSQLARESGYLQIMCDTLKENLNQLPGDARTQVGFICYDAHVHYYMMSDDMARCKELTVMDIDDVFLPSPESLLVNLGEMKSAIMELLTVLPQRHSMPGVPSSALGAALQAAYKLMAPTGGRITVFQTCLPNVGPGALQPREDPNARSSKEVAHLNPATDFYKRLALDCSGAQIAVDLFLLNSQYSDLATLSGVSKFSAGTVYHLPLFKASRPWQAQEFGRILNRYLTRKIGFEAVMRVRCTRGVSIHTFHGNFFVRSTDLLSLPNVSPDAGFGMQLAIDESLSDLQQICFQAALLYTSSKGERRIRVHTLALPIASNLTDILHSADQQCIIGLLSKMAVDRCVTASMPEAREALMNVAVDVLSAHRLAQNLPAGAASSQLHAPVSLALLPLFLRALLKRRAFRTGTSTRLDDRVFDMCQMKTMPLPQLLRSVYPDLYPIHELERYPADQPRMDAPNPPKYMLTAERINSNGAYLLDDGETMFIYVCHAVSPAFLSEIFGVTSFNQLPDESRTLPSIETEGNELLNSFIEKLNDDRPYPTNILVLRDNSPSRSQFLEKLVDDRDESAFSYYEFLQHVKSQVK